MENPFESGHIKNYILFYTSVVVIMILFFIASTLFHEVEHFEKKTFNSVEVVPHTERAKNDRAVDTNTTSRFKMLEKGYE